MLSLKAINNLNNFFKKIVNSTCHILPLINLSKFIDSSSEANKLDKLLSN
jgi:hypothetical protein